MVMEDGSLLLGTVGEQRQHADGRDRAALDARPLDSLGCAGGPGSSALEAAFFVCVRSCSRRS